MCQVGCRSNLGDRSNERLFVNLFAKPQYFHFVLQGGDLKDANKHDVFSEMAIIDIWFRTDKAMIMYLSDGTLQVGHSFFDGQCRL